MDVRRAAVPHEVRAISPGFALSHRGCEAQATVHHSRSRVIPSSSSSIPLSAAQAERGRERRWAFSTDAVVAGRCGSSGIIRIAGVGPQAHPWPYLPSTAFPIPSPPFEDTAPPAALTGPLQRSDLNPDARGSLLVGVDAAPCGTGGRTPPSCAARPLRLSASRLLPHSSP